MTMIRIGFDIEVAEGDSLSATQLVDDLRTVLPKEWWGTASEVGMDGIIWTVSALYALDDGGRPLASDRRYRRPSYEAMQAKLEQERTLTRHQLQRIDLLEVANDNQSSIINETGAALNDANEELSEAITSGHAQVVALESVIDGLRDELAETDKRLSSSLHEYTVVKQQRDDAAANVLYVQDEKDQLITDTRDLTAELAKANLESQVHANMIHKIVDAMEGAGYDISGWGNDAELEELETASTQVTDHMSAARKQVKTLSRFLDEAVTEVSNIDDSMDDAGSEVDGLDALLDNLRTRR